MFMLFTVLIIIGVGVGVWCFIKNSPKKVQKIDEIVEEAKKKFKKKD